MEREDWDRVISIPIGILPTGSGNALCASTLHESRQVHHCTSKRSYRVFTLLGKSILKWFETDLVHFRSY